jgi:hypothetical protein
LSLVEQYPSVKVFDVSVGMSRELLFNEVKSEGEASGNKSWWKRPLGIISIAIFCGLIVAALSYYFGWTKMSGMIGAAPVFSVGFPLRVGREFLAPR